MPTPLVSVVIPTHNRPHFLAQAIDSVRAQTFTDYEIIVVSNGERADPASRSIAAGCRYFQLADANLSRARNVGIEQGQGEWIAFLDDDDLWLPSKLERQIAEAQLSGADMITCDYVEFFPDGSEVVYRPRLPDGWSYTKGLSWLHWWAAVPSTMVRKHVIEQVGAFDPHLRYGEDGDLWRRISWCHSIHQMDAVLVRVRRGHPSLMQQVRKRYIYDLLHFAKMRRDTPHHLRSALPPATVMLSERLAAILVPQRLCRWLRPRTRLNALRARLRIRTRINSLRYRLRLRTRLNALRYRLRIRTRFRQTLAKLRKQKTYTPDQADRREERIERTFIALSGLLMVGGVLALMFLARP
jgi:glycosyltransferase involved in cell wall biosynthesis